MAPQTYKVAYRPNASIAARRDASPFAFREVGIHLGYYGQYVRQTVARSHIG